MQKRSAFPGESPSTRSRPGYPVFCFAHIVSTLAARLIVNQTGRFSPAGTLDH